MRSTFITPSAALPVLLCAFLAGVNAQNSSVHTGTVAYMTGVSANATSSAASSAASAASTSNPMIPSTISSTCQSFLTQLNADSTLSACTQQALTTLSAFTPSLSQSTYSASADEVTTALTTFCATGGCSSTAVRSALNYFNGNCSTELAAGNEVILNQYDTLYILTPLTEAICSKDATGGFCVNDIVNGSVPTASTSSSANATSTPLIGVNGTESTTSTDNSTTTTNVRVISNAKAAAFDIANYAGETLTNPQLLFSAVSSSTARLARRAGSAILALSAGTFGTTLSPRAAATTTSVLPNADTWSSTNVPFLFLNPNMTSTVLCTSCTKTILAGYVAWEAHIPYALGLSNSPLLKGQASLWSGIGQVCGTGFLASTAQQAGQSTLTGAASVSAPKVAGLAVAFGAVLVSFLM